MTILGMLQSILPHFGSLLVKIHSVNIGDLALARLPLRLSRKTAADLSLKIRSMRRVARHGISITTKMSGSTR